MPAVPVYTFWIEFQPEVPHIELLSWHGTPSIYFFSFLPLRRLTRFRSLLRKSHVGHRRESLCPCIASESKDASSLDEQRSVVEFLHKLLLLPAPVVLLRHPLRLVRVS